MALIKCPECNKDMSDKAKACIHCGCPLETNVPIKKSNVPNLKYIYHSKEYNIENVLVYLSIQKKDYAIDEISKIIGASQIESTKIVEELCDLKLDIEYKEYIDNKSINNHLKYMEEIKSPSVKIKCPTCSSTNVTRVSAGEKITNVALFGLFGNKRKMQFKCNNCKYMW